MAHPFVEITPAQIAENAFKAISKDWMLITAGTLASYNTMTASWGGWGHLWGRDVCFCVIRPQRHTFGFMEQASHFTLSFFDEAYRSALDFCGSRSGRDVDKAAATGLTRSRAAPARCISARPGWYWNAASSTRRTSPRQLSGPDHPGRSVPQGRLSSHVRRRDRTLFTCLAERKTGADRSAWLPSAAGLKRASRFSA